MLKEFEIFYHSHVIYVNNSCCTRTSCYCTFCRQTSQFSFCYITNSFSPQSMKDILTSSPHNRCQIFSCSKQLNTRPCLFDTTNNQSLRNTTEWSKRLVSATFETIDRSDEETWPDQKERQLQWQIQRQRQWQRQIHLESTFKEILETCEIWDTDYNFDNWEPGFMTICVTWQLRVTLDSIRNSCDVLNLITYQLLPTGEDGLSCEDTWLSNQQKIFIYIMKKLLLHCKSFDKGLKNRHIPSPKLSKWFHSQMGFQKSNETGPKKNLIGQ